MITAANLRQAVDAAGVARATIDTALTSTTGVGTTVSGLTTGSTWWIGPQGDDLRRILDDSASVATGAWQPLTDMATTLQQLQTTADRLAARLAPLEAERSSIWAPDILTDGPLSVLDVTDHFAEWAARRAEIDREIEGIALEWEGACRQADGVLAAAAGAVTALVPADEQLRLGDLALPTGLVLDTLIATGHGGVPPMPDPAAVAEWWDGLSDTEKAAWLETAPQLLGNTDGIPYETRYEANRQVMVDLLDTLPPRDPRRDKLGAFLDSNGQLKIDLQIVFFDFAGDGRVAQVFGDIGEADNIAVVVPGTGSTMSNFGITQRKAEDLYGSMTDGAVIAWTGYDAPAGIEAAGDDPLGVLEVTSDTQAVQGGEYLASFIGGLHVETAGAGNDPSTTLIGHSYGSLTVGQSLLQGAQVDNVVFIGSPGVGVDHVSEFPPGAADNFYAAEIDGDPVATLEQFGDAPTDPDFGAITFDAGDDDSLQPFNRHSSYFDTEEGLANLTAIAEGGTPTADDPSRTEGILELGEDIHDGLNTVIDVGQHFVHVPFVDEDRVIDGVQTGLDKIHDGVDAVVETGVNVGVDAVEDLGQYLDDKKDEALAYLDDKKDQALDTLGDIRDTAVETVDDTIDYLDERKDEALDTLGDLRDSSVDTVTDTVNYLDDRKDDVVDGITEAWDDRPGWLGGG